MILEKIVVKNFKCFGPEPQTIIFDPKLTAFIGGNGSGKTAALLALSRMFGLGGGRTIVREDFHVPVNSELDAQTSRSFSVDYYFIFPALDSEEEGDPAVPAFFYHIAADVGGQLKCRLRLESTWTDDGSADGQVDSKTFAINSMQPEFSDDDVIELRPADRARIRMIYIPAVRDGSSQVSTILRSRVWRTMPWSDDLKKVIETAGDQINKKFSSEPGVELISETATTRWRDLHTAGTYGSPRLTPVDGRFSESIRNVKVMFYPDAEGRECDLQDLSEGQRSLFHLAMTSTMLEVESVIAKTRSELFDLDKLSLPVLTLVGVEEPENSLAPFYLSRIIRQVLDVVEISRTQAIVSSHSAGMLARVMPEQVRHFRVDAHGQVSRVRPVLLPDIKDGASKYVREAVRAYPELYFARLVVLGEGASEQVVIPKLAEVLGIEIDRSFVAVVPLGGRHVKHLWKLLADLDIPHVTLLDLDLGRAGGGWGRIATACNELVSNGVAASELVTEAADEADALNAIKSMSSRSSDEDELRIWVGRLQEFGVYFCEPLDLDMSMLLAYQSSYMALEGNQSGPSVSDAYNAVLGQNGDAGLYEHEKWDESFRWYRYLFLGRGKPDTHVRVLAATEDSYLKENVPPELRAMLKHVATVIFGNSLDEVKDEPAPGASGD